jgi:carbon monoxide dehydrogenase subunit G
MPRFEGDRDFSHTEAELFARLSDARFLVQCLPDVETVTALDADRATLVLRPGFSFVRGTLEMHLLVTDLAVPTSARYLVHSKGIGSSSEIEASIRLTPHEGGTRVHWVTDVVSLGGLLKLVPAGLIRGAAEKVINDAWDRIGQKLASLASAEGQP